MFEILKKKTKSPEESPKMPMALRIAWKQSRGEINSHFKNEEIEGIMKLPSELSQKIENLLREKRDFYESMLNFGEKSLDLTKEVENLRIEIENLETKLAKKSLKVKKWKKKYWAKVLDN